VGCVEARADRARKDIRREEDLKTIRPFCMVIALAGTLGAPAVQAQERTSALEESQGEAQRVDVAVLAQCQQSSATTDGRSSVPDAPKPSVPPSQADDPNEQFGKQPKRILGIIPNFRAVSANTYLPPLSFKGKFWLATQDTFDYSNFIFVAGVVGIPLITKTTRWAYGDWKRCASSRSLSRIPLP
jgi:hypothetical protein